MNSDTFYILLSENPGKGCITVNNVWRSSSCTNDFGETSGADLGGHRRSQLTKTSGPGWSKSSFLAWNWSVFNFFASPDLLDDPAKFQTKSHDKFVVLSSIPAAKHPIRAGQMPKNALLKLFKISILVIFRLFKTTNVFRWLVKVVGQPTWYIFVLGDIPATEHLIRAGEMSKKNTSKPAWSQRFCDFQTFKDHWCVPKNGKGGRRTF